MKILLIQPPVRDFYITPMRTQPLGISYVAASLIEYGYEIQILDCLTDEKKSIPVPDELAYMLKYYNFQDRSPIKLYTGFYHFGMSYEKIEQEVIKSDADIFGISSMFTPYYNEALRIAEIVKNSNPDKIVVFGGAHTTICPEQILESPHADYAILGEGEKRFPLLIEKIISGNTEGLHDIDGIGFKENGKIKINPFKNYIKNPDDLPMPLYSNFSDNKKRKKSIAMILTSRGCPHKCAYCSHHVMGRFRMRSPESIIDEIKYYNRKGISAFDIEDDNFTFDLNRAKRIMSLIIDSFGENKLELMAMNGISFASLDEELIKLMKKAGFRTLNLAFVTADDSLKYMLKRPKSVMEFGDVVKTAIETGLDIIAYCIFGMPGQAIDEMIDTLIYLAGKRVLIGPSIYYPSPGTVMFGECEKSGFLPPHQSQWRSSAFPVETPEFSRLDLVTLFRLTRMINFIKGRIKTGEIIGGISLEDLFKGLGKENKNFDYNIDLGILADLKKKLSFTYLLKKENNKIEYIKAETSERVLRNFFRKSEFVTIR